MNSTIPAVTAHSPMPAAQHNAKKSRSTSGQAEIESRERGERIAAAGGVSTGVDVLIGNPPAANDARMDTQGKLRQDAVSEVCRSELDGISNRPAHVLAD
jgi:hypothetical protein